MMIRAGGGLGFLSRSAAQRLSAGAGESRDSAAHPAPLAGTGHLVIRGVGKSYEGRGVGVDALQNVDLSVRPREFVSIIGPSGCGKSTLLNIIAGIVFPSAGEILLDDRPITGPGADRGMVFQQYANLPWRTVLQNVELGLKIQGMPVPRRRDRARHFIEMVGLSGFEDRFPRELSGGMQQRVAIARVLACDPAVILFDEPFAALDAQTRELLQEEVVQIWESNAKTIIHVTHSIEEACFLADRVVVMTARPGRIKEIIPINLPRPRSRRDVAASPEYLRSCDRIRDLVREEVLISVTREREKAPMPAVTAPASSDRTKECE